jgi:hypothetical protein
MYPDGMMMLSVLFHTKTCPSKTVAIQNEECKLYYSNYE